MILDVVIVAPLQKGFFYRNHFNHIRIIFSVNPKKDIVKIIIIWYGSSAGGI
jgi:hypothetical protein